MAAQQSVIARAASQLVIWLAAPRPITLLVLLAVCVGLGELAWRLLAGSGQIIAWASGVLSPFCMMCATAIWGMRDRMDDLLDTDQMTAQAYQRFVDLSAAQRRKATRWAALAALAALAAAAPAISHQLAGVIWYPMVLGCGAAVAIAIFGYLLARCWDEQIRAQRGAQKLESKRRQERQELLEKIQSGASVNVAKGWVEGPPLEISKH
ncbi:hypothetical protein [Vandammella animalimorsus]|uniref:hypothetical protein n=1 Tax=Vandammella animalimorsus TaxID=2029117 RepID=UPI00117D4E4D|nr:hypothetical protein [Vandammella animalimorsus]